MSEALWASDFDFSDGRVRVRKTGADLKLDRGLVSDALTWFVGYYLPPRILGAAHLFSPRPAVWFAPDRPRPWYLIWSAAVRAGVRFAKTPQDAIASIYFEDSTTGAAPDAPHGRTFNFDCTDVSKSRVAEVFEAVFGYPLALDPTTWTGPAAEKGELNGAHDGRVVQCPHPAIPGRVYQHLVDNSDGDFIEDLRSPCVGGKPVVVFRKRRPLRDRFANYNTSVSLDRPEAVFSGEELEKISAFAAAMHLDWGGLDILRDRSSGRLYIVDVNKTDMPPLRLPWTDKLRATDLLGKALVDLIHAERPGTGA